MAQPSDTSPAARRHLDRLYLAMSPRAKLERVLALCEATSLFALADLRRRFPGEDEHALRVRLAERTLGPELLARLRSRGASER